MLLQPFFLKYSLFFIFKRRKMSYRGSEWEEAGNRMKMLMAISLRIFSLIFHFFLCRSDWLILTGTPARCRPGNFLVTTGKANISLYYCFFFSLLYLHMSCYKNILNCFYYFRVECVASLIRSHYKSCNKKSRLGQGKEKKFFVLPSSFRSE